MPKIVPPLTDTRVRQAKPREKLYSIADGGGLYLRVSPEGLKVWAARPTIDGKRTTKHLGRYPEMSLAEARQVHRESDGGRVDLAPLPLKKDLEDTEDEHSFTSVSEKWLKFKEKTWAEKSYQTGSHVIRGLLQPAIGNLDIREMKTRDVVPIVRQIANDTPSLAGKAVTYLNGIIDQAILLGYREDDQLIRTRGLLPSYKKGHIPAATRERSIGEVMRAIYGYNNVAVRNALKLGAWTAMRPGILARARWEDIDLKNKEWHVSAYDADGNLVMKTGHDHIVSLPKQAVDMLKEMEKISGGAEYVFPPQGGQRKNKHLSRDALSKALREMGFQGVHAPHGFRATLRTLARERLGLDPDVLEAQLAHAKKDEVKAAYDRTKFNDFRRKAMQEWADYLDRLRVEDAVTPPEDVLA